MKTSWIAPLLLTAVAANAQYSELKTTVSKNGTVYSSHSHSIDKHGDECEISIAGAGWGGVYFAWRLAVDTQKVDARKICIFEANSRIGGRVYSVNAQVEDIGELTVDVGAYRFKTTDHLPSDLIQKRLLMAHKCYDYNCEGNGCSVSGMDSDTCQKVTDFADHSRFILPVEIMLSQLKSLGSKLFFGAPVTGVFKDDMEGHAKLQFSHTTKTVTSKMVFLNVPLPVMRDIVDSESLIFPKGGGSLESYVCLTTPAATLDGLKAYIVYKNAWWYNILEKMQGSFSSKGNPSLLLGRYQDGPVKCVVGSGADGKPAFSGIPTPGGDCRGALLVYFRISGIINKFWLDIRTKGTDALTILNMADHKESLMTVHNELMELHKEDFEKMGINPDTIEKPELLLLGFFGNDKGSFAPGLSSSVCGLHDTVSKKVRRPNNNYDVFVGNVDYGAILKGHTSWAVGSLIQAEKILQAELNITAPSWLDSAWYQKEIADLP